MWVNDDVWSGRDSGIIICRIREQIPRRCWVLFGRDSGAISRIFMLGLGPVQIGFRLCLNGVQAPSMVRSFVGLRWGSLVIGEYQAPDGWGTGTIVGRCPDRNRIGDWIPRRCHALDECANLKGPMVGAKLGRWVLIWLGGNVRENSEFFLLTN